jgi:branched-chain amino acid transport system permease protein
LLPYILSGIQVGSIYALVALGVVLLYRTSKVLNFAQGDFSLIAAFIAFSLVSLSLPLPLVLPLALLASGVFAAGFYYVFIRKAKASNPLNLLILTLGVTLFINGAISQLWGTDSKQAPTLVSVTDTVAVAGINISLVSLVTAAVGFLLMLVLYFFMQYTKIGLAMRAVSQNPEGARSLGIPVPLVLAATWGLSAMLGGAAALLFAPTTTLNPNLMFDPVNKGFAAAVLGGMTSLPGAVLGGYLLGIAEILVGAYISLEFKLSLAFVIIIVVLIVKPEGLLGEPERRRV